MGPVYSVMWDDWEGGDGENNPGANKKIKKQGGTGEWRWRNRRRWLNNLYTACYSFLPFHWRGLSIFPSCCFFEPQKHPVHTTVSLPSLLLSLLFIGVETVTITSKLPLQMVSDPVRRSCGWWTASIWPSNSPTTPLSFSPVSSFLTPSAPSGSGVLVRNPRFRKNSSPAGTHNVDPSANRCQVKVGSQRTSVTCRFFSVKPNCYFPQGASEGCKGLRVELIRSRPSQCLCLHRWLVWGMRQKGINENTQAIFSKSE